MTAPVAEHPYASFVHLVQKPARYLGGEHGSRPKDWASVEARVCLAFPDVYDIGMSHLGFKILYGILNDNPRTLAERALRLQPDLPEAHLALGYSYYYGDNNLDAALNEFEIAQRGLPNESDAFLAIGAIQRRIMVEDRDHGRAKLLLSEAGETTP